MVHNCHGHTNKLTNSKETDLGQTIISTIFTIYVLFQIDSIRFFFFYKNKNYYYYHGDAIAKNYCRERVRFVNKEKNLNKAYALYPGDCVHNLKYYP